MFINVTRAGKGITIHISNEDIGDIIRIIISLEHLGVLIDGVSETVKHEIKKRRRWISLGASLSGNMLTERKGVLSAGKGVLTARGRI